MDQKQEIVLAGRKLGKGTHNIYLTPVQSKILLTLRRMKKDHQNIDVPVFLVAYTAYTKSRTRVAKDQYV